ncbi:MAG: 30S ribosomal protein S8e [Nanoarchaeota archaeon]|nr:30S ribosomal protein S8e [Nanoarchaeota archaeon]
MKTGRKATGGKYKKAKKRKLRERVGHIRYVNLGKEKRKSLKTRGGDKKVVLLSSNKVNLFDPSTKKTQKVEIKSVLETPSNRFLARRNIITKGTIIETEKGKAKVTNRPSQEGTINAILIK